MLDFTWGLSHIKKGQLTNNNVSLFLCFDVITHPLTLDADAVTLFQLAKHMLRSGAVVVVKGKLKRTPTWKRRNQLRRGAVIAEERVTK